MNPLPLVAVAGSPNAGKSALFNALTGARQKVGNYPGVTVERHSGRLLLADGRPVEMVDLPGAYSLDPASPDEAVTRDVLLGRQKGERPPDALLIVIDASNLDNHLRFALQLIELGLPTIIALNMRSAKRDGLELDPRCSKRSSACRVRTSAAAVESASSTTRSKNCSLPVRRPMPKRARRTPAFAAPGAGHRHCRGPAPKRRFAVGPTASTRDAHPVLGPIILARSCSQVPGGFRGAKRRSAGSRPESRRCPTPRPQQCPTICSAR